MADAVVTFLLENLSGRLQEEANFLAGVEDKVNLLIGELSFINIFLKNSQGKRNDEIVKEVVRQIRDVAHEAEDVIDSFISKVAEHRSISTLKRIFRSPSHAMMLRNVGKKIVGIKKKINEIYNNRERYGIKSVEASVNAVEEEEAMHRRRREVEEDDVVGFVHDSTTLVKQLTEGDPKLDVISIIGMGGLGKTTLAKKIYNNLRVLRHFNCHVWVCVSQDFRTRELLLKILKELGMGLEDMSDDELKKQLFRCLQGRRFLVVMDDIWKTKVWDAVRSAFPDDSNGSRILITSRKKKVALHSSPTPPHELPFLNEDESWELFSKKVFRGRTCPPELETIGRQIAKGCQGLPLSIVVLAGLLAIMDKSLCIWSKFAGDVTRWLNRNEDTTICQKILSLSYTDLPEHLKPCFLYFGIYPEDFEIPVRELINLWVAEGFIQQTRHGFPEDDAEMYLEELIDRSLIQVARRRRRDGGVKTCRIHDLLRDLCITESAEEKFLEVHSDNHLSTNNSRRLSIQSEGNFDRYVSSNSYVPSHARSLLFFNNSYRSVDDPWIWLEKNFKLLRVLDYCVQNSAVLKSMAAFIHLRYLRFWAQSIQNIPDSIGNLTNLVTLCVEGDDDSGKYLPKGIFKLQRLRNLILSDGCYLPWDSEGALVNLQVLSILAINYDPQQHSFLVLPEKFPNVRKLKININRQPLTDRHEVVSFPSLHHLAHLETFRIWNCGMFAGNPDLIPSTVTMLTLTGVERVDACVAELGKLRNLRMLKLYGLELEDTLSDVSIHVTAYSFPQLQHLLLEGLDFKEWNQERSAMPRLTHLFIWSCYQFTSAPELLSLTTLQFVKVIKSPRLARMLRNLPREVGFQLLIID